MRKHRDVPVPWVAAWTGEHCDPLAVKLIDPTVENF